jgi:hypothetical protein
MPTTKDYKRQPILVLLFGIVLTGVGIYPVSKIWINKSDLIHLKGRLGSARTYVSMVFSESSRYPNRTTRSQKSELIFHLKEYEQEYYLAEYIGDHYINEDHEAILKGLREADSVSVWIRKNEEHVWRPQIFQIDNDVATLLPFKHLHVNPATVFLIGIGGLFIIMSSIALLRDKSKDTALD